MKKSTAVFLKTLVVLIGVTALGLLLWEPQVEGVNANATFFQIYFNDPFIALVYVGSIPFFYGVYKVFKILGYTEQNKLFSEDAIKAAQTIKYCALAVIGFVVVEEIFIMLNHGDDDATGGFAMGVMITLGSVIVAIVANKFEKFLKNRSGIPFSPSSPQVGSSS